MGFVRRERPLVAVEKKKVGRPPATAPTRMQHETIEALLSKDIGESVSDLSARVGISKARLYKYSKHPLFISEFRRRLSVQFELNKGPVARALIEGAVTPGPGQAAMQRLFWSITGVLKDTVKLEVSGGVNGAMTDAPDVVNNLDAISLETRMMLLADLERAGVGFVDVQIRGGSGDNTGRMIGSGGGDGDGGDGDVIDGEEIEDDDAGVEE